MQGMRYEEGSGTMAGAMLVMVVGIALAVAASVGNLMICQNRARSLADLIAFDAAYALWQGGNHGPGGIIRGADGSGRTGELYGRRQLSQ